MGFHILPFPCGIFSLKRCVASEEPLHCQSCQLSPWTDQWHGGCLFLPFAPLQYYIKILLQFLLTTSQILAALPPFEHNIGLHNYPDMCPNMAQGLPASHIRYENTARNKCNQFTACLGVCSNLSYSINSVRVL